MEMVYIFEIEDSEVSNYFGLEPFVRTKRVSAKPADPPCCADTRIDLNSSLRRIEDNVGFLSHI